MQESHKKILKGFWKRDVISPLPGYGALIGQYKSQPNLQSSAYFLDLPREADYLKNADIWTEK